MATAACLPIAADRAGPCVRTIFFEGLDLTGVTLALEMRLNPETPGAAAVSLGMGNTANAEGLRLVGVTTANGVPTSQVTLRVNETTMKDAAKVPYTGELGSASPLYYDLIGTFGQDKRRLIYGQFIALPTVYGMDNAPANRPQSYGGQSSTGETWNSARLTFTADSATVTLDGADLMGAEVAKAAAAAVLAQRAADGVAAIVPAALPLVYAFDPYGAQATGSFSTANATILLGKNFDELGPVSAGQPAYIKAIIVERYDGDTATTSPVKLKLVRHRRADMRVDWIADIASGLTLQPGENRFEAGEDFGYYAAQAGLTIAVFSPQDGIMRQDAPGDLQGLPYVNGDATGTNIDISNTYIQAHLMVRVELGYAPVRDPISRRLYTFVSNDPGCAGTPDFDGYYRACSGTDGITFPTQDYGELIGKPADYSFRDPSVLVDPVRGPRRMVASAHFAALGAGRDSFSLYAPKNSDAVDWLFLAQVQSGLPGCIGMWAPDFLPYDRSHPPELVVSVHVPGPDSVIRPVPWLYRSTSTADDDFAPVQQIVIQGAGAPKASIDFTMLGLPGGSWIAVAVNFDAPPDETLIFMTAPSRLGPFTVQPRGGVFAAEGSEAPQLKLLPNGNVRLIYDRFREGGLHFVDSADLFVTQTPPVQITTPPFINRAGETVSFAARHGDIV